MKNSSKLLALVILLIASFLTFASTMLAYSEGEESSQQIAAQSFDAWTLVIVVFITAVLVGAMLIFMMAFLQRRRKEVGRKPKSLAHQPSAMNRQG